MQLCMANGVPALITKCIFADASNPVESTVALACTSQTLTIYQFDFGIREGGGVSNIMQSL